MKKSFALLLAFAMVFSAFAPMALAADGEGLTIEEKYQALAEAGIFAGVNADGDAALDEDMTRAQAARIMALIFDLDMDNVPAVPTFTDVNADHWAFDAVEAAVDAGFINGRGDGTFDPSGLVTHQELAVMLALAYENLLGFEIDADATVDAQVAPWAEQYVAFAVSNNILPAIADYTASANRGALTFAAYQGYADATVPAVVGIASAKPSNFNEVTVELTASLTKDQQEDAKFAVNTGSITESVTDVEWSNDGKTAVVTIDRDFRDGTYTVTLSGIENLDEDAASADFQATEERVVDIQFTTPSDTLPQARGVEIAFEAINQYGQVANLGASDFRVYVSDRDVEGTIYQNYDGQSFTIDTYIDDDGRNKLQRGQGLYIRVLHERSGAAADKTFTIGDRPIISKVEFGNLIDENGEEIDYIRSGRTAYLEVAAYDQYGIRINNADVLNGLEDGVNEVSVFTNHRDLEVGTGDDDTAFVDGDQDGNVDLALTADRELAGTFTVTAFSYGGSVTKTVEVKALRVPASVEIPRFDGILADGDENKYIPFKAYDVDGNELTAGEIAENADKFYVTSWGPFYINRNSPIELSGNDRGKIKIEEVRGRGQGQIMVSIENRVNTQVTLNLTASAERVPDRLAWHTEPAAQILNGAESNVRIQVKDQYGANFNKNDEYYVAVTFEAVNNASGAVLTEPSGVDTVTVDNPAADTEYYTASSFHNKTFKIETENNASGSYRLKVALYNDDDRQIHALATKTVRVIDGRDSNDKLNYSVKLEKFNEDGKVMAVAKVLDATYKSEAGKLKTVPELMKEIKIEATSDNGSKVAIVQDIIGVTSSNSNIARGVQTDDGKWYIAGVDNGSANLTVTFNTANGSDVAVISVEAVNAGSDVQSIALSKSNKVIAGSSLNGKYVWDAALAEKITVKDQFGNEFISEKEAKSETLKYTDLLSLTYSVKVTDWGEARTGSVSIDSTTGQLQVSNIGSIKSFDIVVTAPNGKSATFNVFVD